MSEKPKSKSGTKETVLLRQAVPKYNFIGRKLPQESNEHSHIKSGTDSLSPGTGLSSTSSTSGSLAQKTDNYKSKPVAVVGASLQTSLARDGRFDQKDACSLQAGKLSAVANSQVGRNDSKKDHHRQDILTNLPSNEAHDPSYSGLLYAQHEFASSNQSLDKQSVQRRVASPQHPYLLNEDLSLALAEHTKPSKHFQLLESERDQLKRDLEVQQKVNAELKRLLVASVGDDLCERVERLCRDRAQLSLDLGGFSKKMTEESENLDQVSIQADMWRSKYLASRVMTEELGNSRACYSLLFRDSQDALQQMLNERHELRTNLIEAQRVLQQVKSAFDPLNSHCLSSLRSTNVLDLSRSCQQLAEAIRFRLLPGHIAVNMEKDPDDDQAWNTSVTRAEHFAHEVLSRPVERSDQSQSVSSKLLALMRPPDFQVSRFHPHARHENLTYGCCPKCRGEIRVV